MGTKTVTRVITAGQYDGFRVVAILSGPASPALSTLKKRWLAEMGDGKHAKDPVTSRGVDWAVLIENKSLEYGRVERAQASGLAGNCEEELFVDWLKKNHGWAEDDGVQEFYFG